jgi:DNA-3-methyladenine glycosylase
MRKLAIPFYDRETVAVAGDLLGKLLVHSVDGMVRIGRIVEVEAYTGSHDLASHASKGCTKRNQVMFGPPGRAYVYLIYGLYHCLNVVTEAPGCGSAVLLRAIEPLQHISERTQGPGLLCKAMGIDLRYNGHNMTGETLYIAEPDDAKPFKIVAKPRVGVAYAGEWADKALRFYIRDNPFVSRK